MSGRFTALAAASSTLVVALVLSGAAVAGRRHDRVPPSAPTNPHVTSATAHSISIAWNASTDNVAVAGYDLYLNQHRVTLTGTSYTAYRLKCSQRIAIRIVAFDTSKNRSHAIAATVSTAACRDLQAPTSPAGFSQLARTQTSINLAWNASSDNISVAGYLLYRDGSIVATVRSTSSSQTGLTCGTSYTFSVAAFDAAGNLSRKTSLSARTAACATAAGSVLWRADYETGDFSQWWLHQWSINPDPNQNYNQNNVGHSTAAIITSPVAQGRYASKFQVFPSTGTHANDRAEAVATQANSGGYPGQEWYYGWWTDFPSPSQTWWSAGGDWNDITQFQATDDSGGWIYLGIDATGATPALYIDDGRRGKRILAQPLRYDHWYHFIVHVRWSTDPSVGYLELWLNGVHVVPLTYGETLKNQYSPANSNYTSPGMYISQGIYRAAFSSTNTVIHDGLCRANSYTAAATC